MGTPLYAPLYVHTCERLYQHKTICQALPPNLQKLRDADVHDLNIKHPAGTKFQTAHGPIRHPRHRPITPCLSIRQFSWTDPLLFWLPQTSSLGVFLLTIYMLLCAFKMTIKLLGKHKPTLTRANCIHTPNDSQFADTFLTFQMYLAFQWESIMTQNNIL